MEPFNILFTSAGRRVSLVRQFRKALDGLGLEGKTIAADMKRDAPATFAADVAERVPRISDPGYVDALLAICDRYRVRMLVPLVDTELLVLAEQRARFTEAGVLALVASPDTVRIAGDKRRTCAFFRSAGIRTPAILDPAEILSDPGAQYPYLVKPSNGSSSVGVTRVDTPEELAFFSRHIPNAIVQEFVKGQEYTLDVLVDLAGAVRVVVPRLRVETRAGEVSKGVTVRHAGIIEAGRRVVEALPGAVGCITAQCFLTRGGDVVFIEINPRFGGGFPLACRAGADFPRWLIEMALGRAPEIDPDAWEDGLAMLRFDEEICVRREEIAW